MEGLTNAETEINHMKRSEHKNSELVAGQGGKSCPGPALRASKGCLLLPDDTRVCGNLWESRSSNTAQTSFLKRHQDRKLSRSEATRAGRGGGREGLARPEAAERSPHPDSSRPEGSSAASPPLGPFCPFLYPYSYHLPGDCPRVSHSASRGHL